MRRVSTLALALGLILLLVPGAALGQSNVQDQLNRAKAHALYRQSAAFGEHKAREALATFNNFVWPDRKSRDTYLARVEHYFGTIRGCQAEANIMRTTVTCLVPIIDWNPKTWEDC